MRKSGVGGSSYKEYIYNAFYDSELEKSNSDPNYQKFIETLFGNNGLHNKLESVLKLRDQLSYKQFCDLMTLKKKHGIVFAEVLTEMENWKDLNKKHKTVKGSFMTFAKNKYPQLR